MLLDFRACCFVCALLSIPGGALCWSVVCLVCKPVGSNYRLGGTHDRLGGGAHIIFYIFFLFLFFFIFFFGGAYLCKLLGGGGMPPPPPIPTALSGIVIFVSIVIHVVVCQYNHYRFFSRYCPLTTSVLLLFTSKAFWL